jgi:hypothetical protein
MPELGTYGSVRGALSNERPYRDHGVIAGGCFPAASSLTGWDLALAKEGRQPWSNMLAWTYH